MTLSELAERDRLIAAMKPVAAALVNCVQASSQKGVEALLGRHTRTHEEWCALVVVLAECADHGRLRAVTNISQTVEPPCSREAWRRFELWEATEDLGDEVGEGAAA